MAGNDYLASLADGFHLARRMGFTNTSKAFSDMIDLEYRPSFGLAGFRTCSSGTLGAIPATDNESGLLFDPTSSKSIGKPCRSPRVAADPLNPVPPLARGTDCKRKLG